MNTGGRQRFDKNQEVRILELDGNVSDSIYLIDPNGPEDTIRADRKGHVTLVQQGTARTIRVHFRRILPVSVDNEAPVIESGDKFIALCPRCGEAATVTPNDKDVECHACGKFQLHWMGVKPMVEATTKQKPDSIKKEKTKVVRQPKAQREPITPDLDAIRSLENCELWVKLGVKFDHPSIDVRSYTLLYTGDKPRKYCFNTYNGTLGKRGEPLPIENFVADKPIKDAKSHKPWYSIPDLAKIRAKLVKDGYEVVS